ncbi:MAG: LemA family protein [Alphaproteobacteria bacterium]|nr:LemA family protein [Alphaproteobacteria bacterium]
MINVILIIVLCLAMYVIFTYNKAIQFRNFVQEAFATMDVYLKKRWDLLPNLIETVKQYANYEKNILTELTNIRTKNYETLSNNEKINLNTELSHILPKITAVAENYPDLKANQAYTLLMQQMNAVEDDIAVARKYYNGTVRELNTFLELFPTNIIAACFNFKKAKMFEIGNDERQNIKVEL